jgi:hypothetical protein
MVERTDKHNQMTQDDAASNEIRRVVDQAVSLVLRSFFPQLQAKIVAEVLETLPPAAAQSSAPTDSAAIDSYALVQAVAGIQAGSSQKEILRALLDAGSAYCSRIALFVVKAGAASGWQARGFGEDQGVKDFALDLTAQPVSDSYHNRVATMGNSAAMGEPFVNHFGRPANEQVLILPLALKDKVAALVYADGGESGRLHSSALELLVMSTSAWLEVASLRKQAAVKDDATTAGRVEDAPPVNTVSSYSDPFAGHAPMHVPAEIPAVSEPVADVVTAAASAQSAVATAAAAAPATAIDPLAALSPEDAEVHRKAQRFARLLVDEIKLYNQAKVAEGRRNKDLYDRLKEDIDKSRASFQKRYDATVAASGDYFERELLRSLAEDDVSIMGLNFRQ